MKCPSCNETLLMTERNSVNIDYCPLCRGIWLDKGELDKILDYAARQSAPAKTDSLSHGDRYYPDPGKSPAEKGKYYKKKSFLSDFFDFD